MASSRPDAPDERLSLGDTYLRGGGTFLGCLIRCWLAVFGKGVHDGPPTD